MTEVLVAKQLRIAGRVQGVGYRAGFAREAQGMGLAGWVRNRLDGSVEALVRGRIHDVEAIIAWAERGPRLARVDKVTVSDPADSAIDTGEFTVLPTE